MSEWESKIIETELAAIYVVDRSYDSEDLSDKYGSETLASQAEKKWVRGIAGFGAIEVNIGASADLPAFFTLVKDSWVPIFATSAVIFFSGKKIEENIYSWLRMARGISKFFSRSVFLSRTAAASLAIERICDELDGIPKEITLKYYGARHRSEGPRFSVPLDRIEEDVSVGSAAEFAHVFQIVADRKQFLLRVYGCDVEVLRTDTTTQ